MVINREKFVEALTEFARTKAHRAGCVANEHGESCCLEDPQQLELLWAQLEETPLR